MMSHNQADAASAPLRVFLDDVRPAPPGWTLVRWPDEAIALLARGQVVALSLDHDLGDDNRGTGYTVLQWIEEAVALHGFHPPVITVHSCNIAARPRMDAAIRSIARLVSSRTPR